MHASGDVDERDLRVEKKVLVTRFLTNPLGDFFELLAKSLITQSAESIELLKSKTRDESPRKSGSTKKAKIAQSDDIDDIVLIEDLPRPPSMPYVNPSTIPPITPVSKKRDFSDGSYSSNSTETTPSKLSHPEQHTQEIQNCLIRKLIKYIWLGGAEIPWAQGREMYLDYISFNLMLFCADDRSNKTSFRCRLNGNTGDAFDRVTAVSDGALVLITNKRSDPLNRLVWSLQGAALAFEVFTQYSLLI